MNVHTSQGALATGFESEYLVRSVRDSHTRDRCLQVHVLRVQQISSPTTLPFVHANRKVRF